MWNKAEKKAEQGPICDLRMHDEDGLDRHHQAKEQPVDKGLVIGYDQRPGVDECARLAAELDTKECLEEDAR